MPPVQDLGTLSAFGICVGIAMFLILLVFLGVIVLFEEVLTRAIRQVGRRYNRWTSRPSTGSSA